MIALVEPTATDRDAQSVSRHVRNLRGKVAIVTGGTSGIGRATCVALARSGAHVVVVGRNARRLAETVAEVTEAQDGSEAESTGFSGDVRRESDMCEMAASIHERFGSIDILISSAGILRVAGSNLRMVSDLPVAEWDEVIGVNLRGTFLSNRAVLPYMIDQQRGDIINISSKSGKKGMAFDAPYCASKFAVLGLTEALAAEVDQHNIRVQAVLPGPFQSAVWEQNGPIPQPGDLPPADRIAQVIVWMLCLPEDARIPSVVVDPVATVAGSGWHGENRARTEI